MDAKLRQLLTQEVDEAAAAEGAVVKAPAVTVTVEAASRRCIGTNAQKIESAPAAATSKAQAQAPKPQPEPPPPRPFFRHLGKPKEVEMSARYVRVLAEMKVESQKKRLPAASSQATAPSAAAQAIAGQPALLVDEHRQQTLENWPT